MIGVRAPRRNCTSTMRLGAIRERVSVGAFPALPPERGRSDHPALELSAHYHGSLSGTDACEADDNKPEKVCDRQVL